jgi:hypothetical protein
MSGCSPYPKTNSWMSCCCRNALIVLLGLMVGFHSPNVSAAPVECKKPGERQPHPDCGQHNMMLVGEEAVFASHLPMFDSEHRFQLILEVKLRKGNEDSDAIYTRDRKEHPDVRMYTLEPSKIFILARLFDTDAGTRLRSFPAAIFRGHLERRGEKLDQLSDVDVAVERVVYAAEVGPPNGPERAKQLEYIVFGKGKETFIAHRITQPPDFDQLLRVELVSRGLFPAMIEEGFTIVVPDRPNEPARRLRQGETVDAVARVRDHQADLPVKITVIGEPYFEEGELGVPLPRDEQFKLFQPTPLEKEAGFDG